MIQRTEYEVLLAKQRPVWDALEAEINALYAKQKAEREELKAKQRPWREKLGAERRALLAKHQVPVSGV